MKKRGPYQKWADYQAKGFGPFIINRRRQLGLTQAEYAKKIGVGLRTLITAEKDKGGMPGQWAAIGFGMANRDFKDEFEMGAEFRTYQAERGA
jgi:transcriptional regulator with XRE-family HTH domain